MITKQQKIDAIYEKIAKPLNVGDEHKWDFWIEKVFIGDVMDFFEEHSETDKETVTQWDGVKTIKMWFTKEKKIEILNEGLLHIWKKKREPIEEQSYECINIIYFLISEEWEK